MIPLENIDLNLLKLFDILYTERNVSVAAEKLNITQPAASKALNRLRKTLDDQLFLRTSYGMEPTQVAHAIAESVRRGLHEIETSIQLIRPFNASASDRLFTILCSDVGEETYIAELMKLLEKSAPNICVEVQEAPLNECENLLENGSADIAIGRLGFSDYFMKEQIASSKFSILLCAEYAEKIGVHDGGEIPFELYMTQRHVSVLPRATPLNSHPIDKALRSIGRERDVVLTLPHASVLSEILPGTSMIATIPDPAVKPVCARSHVVQAQLPFNTETLDILMIWHRRQQQDKGHSWMREQIRALPMTSWNQME